MDVTDNKDYQKIVKASKNIDPSSKESKKRYGQWSEGLKTEEEEIYNDKSQGRSDDNARNSRLLDMRD